MGNLNKWLMNFLTNRKQRVVIGKATSEWLDVRSGVPQGSVLGPLLFVIFINDMPECTSNECKLFADDSKLISMVRNTRDLSIIQEDIDKLVDWSKNWNLNFNSKKCKFMIIGNKSNNLCSNVKFFMDNGNSRHEIEETRTERDLGITINNKLKWNNQIDKAALMANNMISKLKNSFKYWNVVSFRKLYTTFVRPHLEYCTSVWNPILKKDIVKLEKVQRRATKLVPNLRQTFSYETRFANIGITSLEERRRRGDIIQYYKLAKGYNVAKLHEYQISQQNGHATRSKSKVNC